MKLQQHEGLKLNKMILWEKFCLGVFGLKGAQNGKTFKFKEKSIHVIFLIFYMKSQQYKVSSITVLDLMQIFFGGKKLALGFFNKT